MWSITTFDVPEPPPAPLPPPPATLCPPVSVLPSNGDNGGNDGIEAVDSALPLVNVITLPTFILMTTLIWECVGETLTACVKKLVRTLSKRNWSPIKTISPSSVSVRYQNGGKEGRSEEKAVRKMMMVMKTIRVRIRERLT